MATVTKPRTDPDDILRRVDEDGVEFIRFWFTDINGQLKSFAVGREELEGALDGGDGIRRLVDHRLQPNRGVGHDRHARPGHLHGPAVADRAGTRATSRGVFCDVLRPGGEPYEGDPRFVMRRALARAEEMGFDTYNIGPELEFFYFGERRGRRGRGADDPRQGRLLRPDDARRRVGSAPRHRQRAEGGRDPGRVHAPRGRALAARDRHALRRGPADVRQRDDLPDRGQGDRQPARRLRDVHAEAAVRRERLGDAHPPVAVRGRARTRSTTADDEHHLSAAAKSYIAGLLAPRARDRGAVRAQREQLQAAGARIRGAGLLRLVAAKPLRAGPGPDVPPGQGAGDALRAALPRSLVQSLPDVRGDAARRAGGNRAGLRVPGADGDEPLRAHPRRARGARNRAAPGDARRGDRGAGGLGAGPQGARRPHLRALRRPEASRSGRSTGSR